MTRLSAQHIQFVLLIFRNEFILYLVVLNYYYDIDEEVFSFVFTAVFIILLCDR